jgi:hypothetical protein
MHADLGFVNVAVDIALGAMFGDGAFDHTGAGSCPAWRKQIGQDGVADGAHQVDGGAGQDRGGMDELVAGGVDGDGETAAIGGETGDQGGVGDGGA